MTCAAHVQAIGQGFPGQLGIFDDKHCRASPAWPRRSTRPAAIRSSSCTMPACAPRELIGEAPVCPSDNEEFGARAPDGR